MLDVIVKVDMGDPSGLVTYQKREFNAFIGMKIPLSRILNFKAQLTDSGVYCLLGEKTSDGRRLVYVGQSTNLLQRLSRHKVNPPHDKDWHTVLCFAKKGITETGLLCLERELVKVFRGAPQFDVITERTKTGEIQGLAMQQAIEEISLYLAAMGIDCVSTAQIEERAERFYCAVPDSNDGVAVGFFAPEGFIVKKGSHVSKTYKTDFKPDSYWQRRQELEKSSLIKDYKFTEDCLFSSPSAAAVAIRGYSVNGRTAWHLGAISGESLGGYLDRMNVGNEA